jgi:hypothetical protein
VALDGSGIRRRVVAVSACNAGVSPLVFRREIDVLPVARGQPMASGGSAEPDPSCIGDPKNPLIVCQSRGILSRGI